MHSDLTWQLRIDRQQRYRRESKAWRRARRGEEDERLGVLAPSLPVRQRSNRVRALPPMNFD